MKTKTQQHKRSYRNGETKLLVLPNLYRRGFLNKLDRRYGLCRQLRSEYMEVADDLGGEDTLSSVSRTLVEKFVFLQFVTRTLEIKISVAESYTIDSQLLSQWLSSVKTLAGLAKLLGLERRARQIESDLESYLSKKGKKVKTHPIHSL